MKCQTDRFLSEESPTMVLESQGYVGNPQLKGR